MHMHTYTTYLFEDLHVRFIEVHEPGPEILFRVFTRQGLLLLHCMDIIPNLNDMRMKAHTHIHEHTHIYTRTHAQTKTHIRHVCVVWCSVV